MRRLAKQFQGMFCCCWGFSLGLLPNISWIRSVLKWSSSGLVSGINVDHRAGVRDKPCQSDPLFASLLCTASVRTSPHPLAYRSHPWTFLSLQHHILGHRVHCLHINIDSSGTVPAAHLWVPVLLNGDTVFAFRSRCINSKMARFDTGRVGSNLFVEKYRY